MASENVIKVKIIAPDRLFYEGDAEMVEMTTTEGQVGIYRNHIPLTAVVAPGVVRVHESDGAVKIAALHAGFVEILPESITILAETVEWPEEIDINRANEAKIRAERRIAEKATETNMARAELALKRAVARIETVDEKK